MPSQGTALCRRTIAGLSVCIAWVAPGSCTRHRDPQLLVPTPLGSSAAYRRERRTLETKSTAHYEKCGYAPIDLHYSG